MIIEFNAQGVCIRTTERNAEYILARIGARIYRVYTQGNANVEEVMERTLLHEKRKFSDESIFISLSQNIFSPQGEWWLHIDFLTKCSAREIVLQALQELNR
ncbi:MAG: hypothetical protein WC819_03780 [Parcubacteria group bacterium]|jgi:hypothetical protein